MVKKKALYAHGKKNVKYMTSPFTLIIINSLVYSLLEPLVR